MKKVHFEGLWNGTQKAKVAVVEYLVLVPTTPTWWSIMHVGKIRQGLLIHIEGEKEPFLIDNEHGDGYDKVINYDGSPNASHKSVSNYLINCEDVPKKEWKTSKNILALQREHYTHQFWLKENYPKIWERMEAMRKEMASKKKEL